MRGALVEPLRAVGTAAGAERRASAIRAGIRRAPAGVPLAGAFVLPGPVALLAFHGRADSAAGFTAEGRPNVQKKYPRQTDFFNNLLSAITKSAEAALPSRNVCG